MPGLVPGIHVFLFCAAKTWMAGTSPAMTKKPEPAYLAATALASVERLASSDCRVVSVE
jgi:hypothetical protein